jgi:hypothetical protein
MLIHIDKDALVAVAISNGTAYAVSDGLYKQQ